MFRSSSVGSMELDVNGKKSSISWDGKLSRESKGYTLRADANVNGKKNHLKLQNKNPQQMRDGIRAFFTTMKNRKKSTKKHLRRRRR